MDSTNIEPLVKDIVVKTLEISNETLSIDDLLIEKGLDSMKSIHLIVQLEEKFDIVFEDEEILFENFATINTIMNNIKGKL